MDHNKIRPNDPAVSAIAPPLSFALNQEIMTPLQSKNYVMQLAKTISANGVVDTKELRRMYEVMAAFETGADTRAEILDLVYFRPKELASIQIDEEIVEDEEMRIALAKDILFVESQDDGAATETVARGILDRLRVTPEQMDFLRDWVSWENAALKRLGAGDAELADEGSVQELASRAASVGVPLSALYFAGAVGFSAVGITSGLAALGSASGLVLLGLNPMTAGIAALIVTGVSVKKICDFALKRGKKREIEAALQRAKELQLRYREFLVHDLTQFEKSSISDWLAGRASKRKGAIDSFRTLIAESIQQPTKA
jgi:hypothetical protein